MGSNDPKGFDLIVNATPLGMNAGDPLPFDTSRIGKDTFVGEVVMKQEITPLLKAAQEIGCRTQVGTDMLFEQIPAYLEFFGFGTSTPDELRSVAKVSYWSNRHDLRKHPHRAARARRARHAQPPEGSSTR